MRLHGITADVVADQPSFCDRLARPVALATGMQLVAHNAPPTIGALREACAAERKWPKPTI